MKRLMVLTLLCGFGAASASADTQGCRKRHEQEHGKKMLEKKLKDLIDSLKRENPDWNRPHWHPEIMITPLPRGLDPLKR